MSDQTTNTTAGGNGNGGPRHLYDTGKFATLPPHLQPYRPKKVANAPRPTSPHLAADGSKVQSWPLAVDPNPTGRFAVPAPRPSVPHPTFVSEPAMSPSTARSLGNVFLYLAGVAALIAVVVFVATVVIR